MANITQEGLETPKSAKEYLHSDRLHEDDSVFDPGGKQEYTEEQLLRFADLWVIENKKQFDASKDQYEGKTRTGGLSPDTGPRN